tara:strand:- start:167 stop:451 length:285 start_codon:yes stop_codon:yes gene_type:complete
MPKATASPPPPPAQTQQPTEVRPAEGSSAALPSIGALLFLLLGVALVWAARHYRRRQHRYSRLALQATMDSVPSTRRSGATQMKVFDYTQNRFV